MATLPEGPDHWQFYHQNYARLLLKGSTRDQILITLAEIKRIQGDSQEQMMRDFLNHEKQSMADGVELVKPDSVIAQEQAYRQSQFDPKSKDEKHEQHKRDIAASDEFIERLAS